MPPVLTFFPPYQFASLLKIKVLHDAIRTFTIWRTFLFHKNSVVKEGYSDYKKVRKRGFFKEPLSDWFIVETKTAPLFANNSCSESSCSSQNISPSSQIFTKSFDFKVDLANTITV